MQKKELLDALHTIDMLCRIAMNNASASAKAEVVGRCSGRTLGDILAEIRTTASECRVEVAATLPVSF